MKKQDKALIISIVIFVVVAIIALCIVLNKGKIFGLRTQDVRLLRTVQNG